MTLAIKVVNSLSQEKWRSFVENHPSGHIFHTPEMFEIFSRTKNHQPALWAAVTDNDTVMALFLSVRVAHFQALGRFTTRAICYGDMLCSPGPAGQQALSTLLQSYIQHTTTKALFTEIRNLTDTSEMRPTLCECGFRYEDHLNYLINLKRPVEEIMQGIGKRTRKHIRQGLRQADVVIEEATTLQQIATCYSLLRKTYSNAQVPLADQSLFEAAFNVLYPKGMVRFLLARVGKTNVATSVELAFKDTVYGWYGGLDRAYGSFRPNELLMWHILQWSTENGYAVYDFGGAGKPDEDYGVRDFKAKFGGELINPGRYVYVHSPIWLKIISAGYKLSQKIGWHHSVSANDQSQ
jgi:CelD/BcsL family acetyltransferase involved in cellulose biosynthesis